MKNLLMLSFGLVLMSSNANSIHFKNDLVEDINVSSQKIKFSLKAGESKDVDASDVINSLKEAAKKDGKEKTLALMVTSGPKKGLCSLTISSLINFETGNDSTVTFQYSGEGNVITCSSEN